MSEGFILNHRGEEVEGGTPRIIGLQIEDSGNHFHKINYKKDLKHSLQKDLFFETPGLLTRVEYFEDNEKNIPVLTIHREYTVEPNTRAIQAKRTKRVYFCEDGTEHPEIKDGGWYMYTPGESRQATHRRRVNIVNTIEADLVSLLSALAGPDVEALKQSMNMAAELMSQLSTSVNRFFLSGDASEVITTVNDPLVQISYPFLAATIPGTGATGAQYITAKLTY